MTPNEIAKLRVLNQKLTQPDFRRAEELVQWMGAMQAQDFGMVKWAVGIRIPGSTEQSVEEAIRKGEIIRTHLMRPTWHLVSAADVYWILELTAPHIKPMMRSRHKQLGLTEDIVNKSKSIIEKALQNGIHLTRDEIGQKLRTAKLVSENAQVTHIMMICELDLLVCSGEQKGKNQTYALLEERVAKPLSVPREEALAKLASRYFKSHGPATLQDFIWWSGLLVKDARNALELVKSGFGSIQAGLQEYWYDEANLTIQNGIESVHFLPAYDEYIISYKDRSATLNLDDHKTAISNNGFFHPVIVANGKVLGTWKRIQSKGRMLIETKYFESGNVPSQQLLKDASKHYGLFLNQETEIVNRAE